MEKRCILLFLLLNLFGILFVSASCDENEFILSLSSQTNAHASINPGYGVDLCYSYFFEGGDLTRICNDYNLLLKLSSPTNAHAESKHLENYETLICFGNLSCDLKEECLEDETCLVTLSSQTNAHLALCDSSSPYQNKLCCKVLEEPEEEQESPPTEGPNYILKWFNPFGDQIIENSYSCSLEYGTCNLTLEVSGIGEDKINEGCDIEIYQKRIFPLPSTKIETLTSTINENGICNVSWDFFEISKDSGFSNNYFFKYEGQESSQLRLIVNSTLNIPIIASCGDYKTKNSCESDTENVAKYSVGNQGNLCGKDVLGTFYRCYCSWNESNSICQGTLTSFQFDDDPTPLSPGSCLYTYETDDTCEDGFLLNTIKTSFNWTSQSENTDLPEYLECLSENNKQIIIPCPSAIKVPFFSYLQILIVLGLVFAFYNKKYKHL